MYKLKYRYKGSKHIWTHTFKTKSQMAEWRKTFRPFVTFVK